MTRLSICVTIVCAILVTGSVWYLYMAWEEPRIRVTIQPHASMTAAGHQCARYILPYILRATYDPRTVCTYLQYALPHVCHIAIRWQHPRHAHCTLKTAQPLLRIHDTTQSYIIMHNGTCISHVWVPQHISDKLPRLSWQSSQSPYELAHTIVQMYQHIPYTWWSQYQIAWHTPHDIRLHAGTPHGPHIRTRADCAIDSTLQHQIQCIEQELRDKTTQKQTWIDIRFPRHAIVYPKIRGR